MNKQARLTFILIGTLVVADAMAQMPMEIFENPSNLQVLPEDISPEALRDTMFSFGQQVGLRCSRCHNFEPETPMAERDFASDERELKRVAREMLRMVSGINEAVSSIDRGPDHNALTVQCVTCHRGVSQPRQIEDVFASTTASNGLDAAISEYLDLRQNWYAMAAYDFTAWKLGGIAQEVVDNGDLDGGMQVHALNFELNPDDGSIYFHRAETYEKQGRIPEAIADYRRTLEMEPESMGFLSEWIERLEGELDD